MNRPGGGPVANFSSYSGKLGLRMCAAEEFTVDGDRA